MKKLIIAITSVFLLLAPNAMSMDLRPVIGVSGNIGVFAATGTEKNFSETGTLKTTTDEHGVFSDEFGSVFLEASLNDTLSIGIDYVPHTIETPENISNEDGGETAGENNQNKVQAHFDELTTVYAKINLPLGGTYLKLGYSSVDVISKEIMNSGTTYGNDTSSGPTVGIGYDHEVTNGISIRAEVTGTEFSDVSANNGVASTGNRNEISVKDMIGARGTISLVKTF